MGWPSTPHIWMDSGQTYTLVSNSSFHIHHSQSKETESNNRIVPILALIPFGFGMVSIFLGSQTYIVDSFSTYAASAVAATTCLRSLVGTFLVSTLVLYLRTI